jgi:hypothetical protein
MFRFRVALVPASHVEASGWVIAYDAADGYGDAMLLVAGCSNFARNHHDTLNTIVSPSLCQLASGVETIERS